MLMEICKIIGIQYDHNDTLQTNNLRAIAQLIPPEIEINISNPQFINAVTRAKKRVDSAGPDLITKFLERMFGADPTTRPTIKVSPKGSRIRVAGKNGVRYSFGPIWNQAVIDAAEGKKSIAMDPVKRHKLDHQAFTLGLVSCVEEAEKIDLLTLNKMVAPLVQGGEASPP